MGKLRRITIFMMIPVSAILIAEGLIYYSASGFSSIEVFLLTLENTCMAFIARPTLSATYAFKSISDKYSELQKTITHLYAAVIILAPILTTTAVIAGFQAFILEIINSVKVSFKKRMYIIGDGNMIKRVCEKYAKEYRIIYLMPGETSNVVRVPYLKKAITAFPVDYKNIKEMLVSEKIEKAPIIVINFSQWFENYKAISDLLEYLIENSDDDPTNVLLIDAPELYQSLFEKMYSGLCVKYNRSETVLSVTFVTVDEINLRRFFSKPQLTEQPGGKHHIMVTGLGRYGRVVVTELVRNMKDNGYTGTIDVFDPKMTFNISSLIYSSESLEAMNRMERIDPVRDAVLSVLYHSDAGPIYMNYYRSGIGELKYTDTVLMFAEKDPVTEFFFCINNISLNFDCFRIAAIDSAINANVRYFFRVGPELAGSFEAIENSSSQLRRLPDELPDIEIEKYVSPKESK